MMYSEKQGTPKVRYAPNKKDKPSDDAPHPDNKKQEKEYREQKNSSDDENTDVTDES